MAICDSHIFPMIATSSQCAKWDSSAEASVSATEAKLFGTTLHYSLENWSIPERCSSIGIQNKLINPDIRSALVFNVFLLIVTCAYLHLRS